MAYNPDLHHRRCIRLRGYDYSQPGAYFVTICAHGKTFRSRGRFETGPYLFGNITEGIIRLNRFGRIVELAWFDLPRHYPHVTLDAFVIMPDHVHGIIVLNEYGDTSIKRHGLPEIVRGFKTFSARRINRLRRTPGTPV